MKTLLKKEIESKFEKLTDMDPTTSDYVTAVDGVTKLMDRAIEFEKIKEDRKNNVADKCIDVGKTLLPLAASIWIALVSLKFEESGTITTTIGRKTLEKLYKK